ncbi:hypothetical protein [Pararhodospirillum photometricum]|nr:hypothetical protein [Pararhodospirillum photometricum]
MSFASLISRRRFLAVTGGAVVALGAGACTPAPAPRRAPDLRFSNRPPLVFRASRVDVREDYHSPLRAPNVEQDMPLPPLRAARQWGFDRLQADGSARRTVVLSIRDAAVTEKSLAVRKGVQGAFNTDQAERYDASLDAVVELIDNATGVITAQATARVSRFVTVPEDASVVDRENAWVTLVEGLMADFDGRMEQAVRSYMAPYVLLQ